MSDTQQRVFKPVGPLIMDSAAEHVAKGRDMAKGGDLVVDLSGITECDSAALALMLDWMRACTAQGGKVSFRSIPPGLVSLAQVYGVDDLLSPDEVTGNA